MFVINFFLELHKRFTSRNIGFGALVVDDRSQIGVIRSRLWLVTNEEGWMLAFLVFLQRWLQYMPIVAEGFFVEDWLLVDSALGVA